MRENRYLKMNEKYKTAAKNDSHIWSNKSNTKKSYIAWLKTFLGTGKQVWRKRTQMQKIKNSNIKQFSEDRNGIWTTCRSMFHIDSYVELKNNSEWSKFY